MLPASATGPEHDTVWISFPGHEVLLVAELVDTDAEQHLDLAGRDSLAEGRGMLFVSKQEERTGMWMKGMRFPIDILWFNSDYRLVSVARNVEPGSYPEVYWPARPAQYVLEVRAGFVTQYNIAHGDRITVNHELQNR
jgi:uncharacterized membrane protein (UPF0127 family)